MSGTRRPAVFRAMIWPVCVVALVFLVYRSAVNLGFVSWDDGMNFSNDRFINVFTVRHAVWLWRHPYAGVYMPVSYCTFGLLSLLARRPDFSLDPHVYHAFNVIVHLLNVLLVYWLLVRIVKDERAAFCGAAVFGLHPIQVESVAWASDLVRVLAACFGLFALAAYVTFSNRDARLNPPPGRWAWLGVAVIAGVLSLLSKPGVVTLPLIAFAIDVWLLGRPWKRAAAIAAVWVILSLPAVAVALIAEPSDHVPPLWSRPTIMLDSLAFYIGKFVWPWPLCVDYGRSPYVVLHSWWRYVTWLAPVGVALVVWWVRRRHPWLVGASLASVFALIPVSGLVPFIYQDYSTVTDRYAYFAVLGLSIVAAYAVRAMRRPGALAAAAVVLGAYCALTVALIPTWKDSVSLYRQALRVAPGDFNSHYMLGLALISTGDLAAASREAQTAAALNPAAPENLTLRGELLVLQNRCPEAIAAYRQATQRNKSSPNAYHALGMLLIETGRVDEGLSMFRTALRMAPDDPLEHDNLATALAKSGHSPEALSEYLLAERIDPDYRATHLNLVELYAQTGRIDGVASESRAMIRLFPGDEVAHVNLGQALLAEGDARAADAEFRLALKLAPDDAEARDGVAAAEHAFP